jgi:hypothetical protein
MIALLLAASLAQATPAPDPCNAAGQPETPRPGCPAWRLVRRTDEGAGWLDPASVRREGDQVILMTRTTLPEAAESGMISILGRVRMDCTQRTVQLILISGWTAAGVRLFEGVPEDPPGRPVAGSASAAMLDEYCPRGDQGA